GIVQSVENSDDVDTVLDGHLDEFVDDVVCIVLVTQNVLTSQKHLQLCVGHSLLKLTQSLPRILVEESEAGVERSAAPALYRIISDLVQFGRGGKHLVQT